MCDPSNIRYLREPTPEEIALAIKIDYRSYKHFSYQYKTYELTKHVIQKDGNLILFAPPKHITTELAMIAISQRPESLRYILRKKKVPEESLIKIINNDPTLIQYIPCKQLTLAIAKTAIDKNLDCFQYIRGKSSMLRGRNPEFWDEIFRYILAQHPSILSDLLSNKRCKKLMIKTIEHHNAKNRISSATQQEKPSIHIAPRILPIPFAPELCAEMQPYEDDQV